MTWHAQAFQGPSRDGRPRVRAVVIGASLLAHLVIAALASRPSLASQPGPPRPLPAAVAVLFVKPRPARPDAAPAKKPAKTVALKASRGPRAMVAAAPDTRPPLAPPPPRDSMRVLAPAPAASPRPIVLSGFTVSAVSGGVKGGIGNGSGGDASGRDFSTRGSPGGDGSGSVSQPPVVLNAGNVDIKRYYPPAALREGFEGAVSLSLVIDADGTMVSASIARDPGEGLGEAALRAVREFRFSAGRLNGERVRAVLPFVIRFVIHL